MSQQGPLLITGAAGFVASTVIAQLNELFQLRLSDRRKMPASSGIEFIGADLADSQQLRRVCEGARTVLHLAAEPDMHAPFEDLYESNIIGAQTLFEAAYSAGCARVIFASSINAVLGYPATSSITWDQPVNPINPYGVSKCFGEALAREYANRGLSSICLRMGVIVPEGKQPPAQTDPYHNGWISARDLATLISLCVTTADIDYAIVHAQSRHRTPRLSIEHTCKLLGYLPQDGSGLS